MRHPPLDLMCEPARLRRQVLARPNPARAALLRLLWLLGIWPPRPPCPTPPRRILIVQPGHVGDTLFVTPALRRLRQAWPEAHVTCLVGPWSADVVARSPHVDEVMACPFSAFTRGRPLPTSRLARGAAPYARLLQLAASLRRHRFDLAISLRSDDWWTAAVLHLSGIPVRAGFAAPAALRFLSHALAGPPRGHAVQHAMALIEAVTRALHPAVAAAPGGDEQLLRPRAMAPSPVALSPPPADAQRPSPLDCPLEYPVRPEERATAQHLLRARGLDGPLVALHPGAGGAAKQWPASRFASLAAALVPRFGRHLLLTGVNSERSLIDSILSGVSVPATSLAGETTLGVLAGLFERCSLVLGTDNGALHLATALDVPTVRIHGPSDSVTFGPWGDPARHRVVLSPRPCSPCHVLDLPPADPAYPCMVDVGVDEVLAAAHAVLGASVGPELRGGVE